MLKNLSRILSVIGVGLAMLTSMYLTYFLTWSYLSYGFFIGILMLFVSTAGLAGSVNVHERPVFAGAVMVICGMLSFTLLSVFSPGLLWPAMIPYLMLAATGVLALVSNKKTFSKEHRDENQTQKE